MESGERRERANFEIEFRDVVMESDAAGSFPAFFKQAMGGGQDPYPYQEELATEPIESRLIHVPTGAGKTDDGAAASDEIRLCASGQSLCRVVAERRAA